MEKLDFSVQQGNVLLSVCKKHPASDGTDGIAAEDIELLENRVNDASAKDILQKKAVENLAALTANQNARMTDGNALIRKTRDGAKGQYGEDNKAMMKKFHIGAGALTSVKSMSSELEYMKEVTNECLTDLAKAGIKSSDISAFDSISTDLKSIDADQESAKKVQKARTKERDDALDALRKTMRRIRNKAKSIFADNQSVLTEFEPVAEGRGGAKKGEPPAPPQGSDTKK